MNATIKGIEFKKSKAGGKFMCVCFVTEDNKWERDWISENAPAKVANRWWSATGQTELAWNGLASTEAFNLIDCEVDVDMVEGDYGMRVEEVRTFNGGTSAPAPTAQAIPSPDDDDIPF